MPELRLEELDAGSVRQLHSVMAIERRSFRNPWTFAEFQFLAEDARALNLGLWRNRHLVGYAIGYAKGPDFHLAKPGGRASLAPTRPCDPAARKHPRESLASRLHYLSPGSVSFQQVGPEAV